MLLVFQSYNRYVLVMLLAMLKLWLVMQGYGALQHDSYIVHAYYRSV
jgi:hypothetical protein